MPYTAQAAEIPTDQQLVELWSWTVHQDPWEDPCTCEMCTYARRNRWEWEQSGDVIVNGNPDPTAGRSPRSHNCKHHR
ncbi:MAG: hypothetical protein QNK79_05600 [Synechococcus sp. ArSW.bin.68]